jgi:hypothetical protein
MARMAGRNGPCLFATKEGKGGRDEKERIRKQGLLIILPLYRTLF